MAHDLIEFVGRAEGAALAALVFAMVFAESAILLDLVVPGEIGLLVGGAAAAYNDTPIVLVIVAAALGALAGDSLGFWLGRRFGPEFIGRWPWTRRLLQPSLRRARRHFERHGGRAVAIARWVGALRAVVPVVAGSARLSYRSFLAWGAPSAVAWSMTVATIGYVWGDDMADVVNRVGLGISIVAVVVLGLLLWRGRRRRASRNASS